MGFNSGFKELKIIRRERECKAVLMPQYITSELLCHHPTLSIALSTPNTQYCSVTTQCITSVLLCHHPTLSVLCKLPQAVAFKYSSLKRWIGFSPDPKCIDIFYDFCYKEYKPLAHLFFSIYCFFNVLVFIGVSLTIDDNFMLDNPLCYHVITRVITQI